MIEELLKENETDVTDTHQLKNATATVTKPKKTVKIIRNDS